MVCQVYPSPKVQWYSFYLNTTDYDDHKSIFPAAAYFHSQIPRLADEGGFQGYIYVHPNAIRANLMCPNSFADAKKMIDMMDPILDKMTKFPGIDAKSLYKTSPLDLSRINVTSILSSLAGTASTPKVTPSPAPFENQTPPKEAAGPKVLSRRHNPGGKMVMPMGVLDQDSRLFGKEELTSPNLGDVYAKAMPYDLNDAMIRIHLVSGPKVWAQGNDTSVHPAWRRAYVHAIATGAGTPNAQSFRDLAPDSGAYVNEVRLTLSRAMQFTNMTRLGLEIRTGRKHSGDQIIPSFQRSNRNGIQTWSST
jgi:hypothetical protein